MREEYDPLNASFPAHLSIFSHFDFVSLEAETQNIVFRLLKAESRVFDVDILTPMLMRSEGHLALTQNEDRKFKRKVLLIAMKI